MGRSKDPVLSVRLPGDLEAKLNAAAERLDLSKNDIARHAIRAAVAAIEANDYHISLPLEMLVKKGPVESSVSGVLGYVAKKLARADGPSSGSTFTASVNEEPPAEPLPPKLRGPKARSTGGISKIVDQQKRKP